MTVDRSLLGLGAPSFEERYARIAVTRQARRPAPTTDQTPPPPAETAESETTSEAFNPGAHTIPDVLAYVEAHPDQLSEVYASERDGKARSTLLAELEQRGAP